jgi:hypothetical protein
MMQLENQRDYWIMRLLSELSGWGTICEQGELCKEFR